MPTPQVMILLEEAIQRFNSIGREYGVGVRAWKSAQRPRRAIAAIEEALDPLRIPAELRAFWATHDPGSLHRPVLDGFIGLEQTLDRREIDCPPAPQILLPLADWTLSRLWIELGTVGHPGGRVFHSHHDETEVSLWAFGVSDLFDLLSEAFERDLLDDRLGTLSTPHVERLVSQRLDRLVGDAGVRRIEAIDRSQYPLHWQLGEGLAIDHFELRGASHTVEELLRERDVAGHASGTLVGEFHPSIAGGPLAGCVGDFRDETGSTQIFVPQRTATMGALGPGGRVEMDVLAVRSGGMHAESLPARREVKDAGRAAISAEHLGWDVLGRLMDQMQDLDTSIVATTLRPVR